MYKIDRELAKWEKVEFKAEFEGETMSRWGKQIQVNKTDIYFISGTNKEAFISNCFKYNTKLNAMTRIKNIKRARSAFGIVNINEYIYVIGG
jgi:hypothetical protein